MTIEWKYLILNHGVFDTRELAEDYRYASIAAQPEVPIGEPEMIRYNPEYKVTFCSDTIWDIVTKRIVHHERIARPAERVDVPVDIRRGQRLNRYFHHISSVLEESQAKSELNIIFKNMVFKQDGDFVERIK